VEGPGQPLCPEAGNHRLLAVLEGSLAGGCPKVVIADGLQRGLRNIKRHWIPNPWAFVRLGWKKAGLLQEIEERRSLNWEPLEDHDGAQLVEGAVIDAQLEEVDHPNAVELLNNIGLGIANPPNSVEPCDSLKRSHVSAARQKDDADIVADLHVTGKLLACIKQTMQITDGIR
jgi:hypothetical protein